MTTEDFRLFWAAERRYMLERGRAFCAELRRQEDQLRALLPALRSAFRMQRALHPGVNDNREPY